MFNILNRGQSVANNALTSLITISLAIIAITFVQLNLDGVWSINTTSISNIVPTTSIKHSYHYGSQKGKPKENSKVTFDLEADLRPLFNWNTKQIFVYVTAEYPGKSSGSSNRVTYWDKIITTKDEAVLKLKNQRSKYSVWDVEPTFRERDAILRLEWNIQPYVGPLIFGMTNSNGSFRFAESPRKKN